MKLLIDADFIVYKSCAAAETECDFGEDVIVVTSSFREAFKRVERDIQRLINVVDTTDLILFFSHPDNFRKKIFPEYKGSRTRKKPCGYRRVIEALKDNYKVVVMPTLEADDSLGIYQTMAGVPTIIASPDKDMQQIPGRHYDMSGEKFFEVTEEEGRRFHLLQTLAGDSTDGYSGCPGYGMKKAEQLLAKENYSWKAIREAFEEKGLTEDDALLNARLARILTDEDYDFQKGTPILWTPSASDGANAGAEPTTEETDRPAA